MADLESLSDEDLLAQAKLAGVEKELQAAQAASNAAAATHSGPSNSQAYDVSDEATRGMSTLDLARAELGQGMANAGRHIGNVLGMVPDQDLAQAQHIDAAIKR